MPATTNTAANNPSCITDDSSPYSHDGRPVDQVEDAEFERGNVVLSYTPNNRKPLDELYSRINRNLNHLGFHPHHLIPRTA
jgi:hypothetical protein